VLWDLRQCRFLKWFRNAPIIEYCVLLEIMKKCNKQGNRKTTKKPGSTVNASGNNISGRSANELVAQKVEKLHQVLI